MSEICRGLEPFLAIRSRRSGQKSSEKCELLSDQAYSNGWMQNCNSVNVSSFSQTPSQAKCEHCEATSALLDRPVVRRFSAFSLNVWVCRVGPVFHAVQYVYVVYDVIRYLQNANCSETQHGE